MASEKAAQAAAAAAAAASPGALHSMCRKTRICKYFSRGRCTRQGNCDFAHSPAELRPLPDLSCTKVCPSMLSTGKCDRPGCTFAHGKAEMRKVRLSVAGKALKAPRVTPSTSGAGKAATTSTAAKAPDAPPPSPLNPLEGAGASFSRQSTPEALPCRQISSSSADSFRANSSVISISSQVPPPPAPHAEDRTTAAGRKAASGGDWGQRFHKTAMCAFFRQGKCKRGADCHFAHGEEELKALPDLFRTKLCAKLLSNGSCVDADCRYAHNREELRTAEGEIAKKAEKAAALEEDRATAERAATKGSPSQGAVAEVRHWLATEEAPIKLCVKNTFLDIDEPAALDVLPPKAKSQPTLPALLGGDDSDSEAETEPQQQPASLAAAVAPPETPEESALQVARSWLRDLPEISFSTEELLVKNTFLTLDEPTEPCTMTRTKSAPTLSELWEDCSFLSTPSQASVSTIALSASLHDIETGSSDSSPKSVNLDFVNHAVELPLGYLAPFDLQEAEEVPCCAIQKVDPLEEAPEGLDVEDCFFALPAAKKVLIKPGAFATQGKSSRAALA